MRTKAVASGEKAGRASRAKLGLAAVSGLAGGVLVIQRDCRAGDSAEGRAKWAGESRAGLSCALQSKVRWRDPIPASPISSTVFKSYATI
jgi:hypothetical protein